MQNLQTNRDVYGISPQPVRKNAYVYTTTNMFTWEFLSLEFSYVLNVGIKDHGSFTDVDFENILIKNDKAVHKILVIKNQVYTTAKVHLLCVSRNICCMVYLAKISYIYNSQVYIRYAVCYNLSH